MHQVLVTLVGVVAMIFCGLIATAGLWIPYFLRVCADHNFFTTSVEENTIKCIMKVGRTWRFITPTPINDPYPNPNDPILNWRIPETVESPASPGEKIPRRRSAHDPLLNVDGEESAFVNWIDFILPGGLRWVGLPFIYSVYEYDFRWDVLRPTKPVPEEGCIDSEKLPNEKYVVSFSKKLDYIFGRDAAYYFELIGAESRGTSKGQNEDDQTSQISMPLDLFMLATIRVVNPYQTLFHLNDWLNTILDLVRPTIRHWVAVNPYNTIVGKEEAAERSYDPLLRDPSIPEKLGIGTGGKRMSIVDYIECTYGVRIKRIAFDAIIPPAEYTKAAIERASSEQKRIATITQAEGERDRQTIVAAGEASRIKIVTDALKAAGPEGLVLRGLEAAEAMGVSGNVIVMGENPGQVLINSAKSKGKG